MIVILSKYPNKNDKRSDCRMDSASNNNAGICLYFIMIKTIKHGINLLRNKFRDVGVGVKRSGEWPTVEKHFLEAHPTCAACEGTERLNIHHCRPFHTFPQLELDTNNLITLCMGELECHLQIGHCGDFKLYNPNVRKDAEEALKHPEKRDTIIKQAKLNAKKN